MGNIKGTGNRGNMEGRRNMEGMGE